MPPLQVCGALGVAEGEAHAAPVAERRRQERRDLPLRGEGAHVVALDAHEEVADGGHAVGRAARVHRGHARAGAHRALDRQAERRARSERHDVFVRVLVGPNIIL